MRTQELNLSTDEVLKRIGVASDSSLEQVLIFRGVFIRNPGHSRWSLLAGEIRPTNRNEELESQKCNQLYPNYHFICDVIEGIAYPNLLNSIADYGNIPDIAHPKLEPPRTFNWTETLVPSNASRSSYPERNFSLKISETYSYIDEKLLGYGLPFHLSAEGYIKDFLRFDPFRENSTGVLTLNVLDKRARIEADSSSIVGFAGISKNLSLVG